jgi:hypothetical protein
MLLRVAILLVALDLLTTLVAVHLCGPGVEANGFYARLIGRHGVLSFSFIYLASMGVVLALSALFDGLLIGFASVLFVVVLNNLYALWRCLSTRV